jgi:hypothetical protein
VIIFYTSYKHEDKRFQIKIAKNVSIPSSSFHTTKKGRDMILFSLPWMFGFCIFSFLLSNPQKREMQRYSMGKGEVRFSCCTKESRNQLRKKKNQGMIPSIHSFIHRSRYGRDTEIIFWLLRCKSEKYLDENYHSSLIHGVTTKYGIFCRFN